jgi:hypothetical protein
MKHPAIAPLALVIVALSLSGCFFPGGYYHDRGHYGGGYDRPEGPPPGAYGGGGGYPHPGGGYHQEP